MLRSCILRTYSVVYKNAFWVAAWRWLYKEADTCRWYDLLIMLYNKGCVRLIYIYIYIYINYWKHNWEASPGNHSRYLSCLRGPQDQSIVKMSYELNVIQISQHRQPAATRHCHRTRRKFDCPDYWVITLSPQTGGPWAQVLTPLDVHFGDLCKKWVQIQGAHMAVIGTISSCAFRTSLKEVFTVMHKPWG